MATNSLDKNKIKFLLLEGIHSSAVDVIRAAGYTQIETVSGALPDEELKRKIADVHFVGIRSRTQLTEEVFAQAHKLVAVGCFCIGTNQVDLNAARERGIVVTTTGSGMSVRGSRRAMACTSVVTGAEAVAGAGMPAQLRFSMAGGNPRVPDSARSPRGIASPRWSGTRTLSAGSTNASR